MTGTRIQAPEGLPLSIPSDVNENIHGYKMHETTMHTAGRGDYEFCLRALTVKQCEQGQINGGRRYVKASASMGRERF